MVFRSSFTAVIPCLLPLSSIRNSLGGGQGIAVTFPHLFEFEKLENRMSESVQVGTTTDEPEAFGFSIPPLAVNTTVIEFRVTGDYGVRPEEWPRRLAEVSTAFAVDLARFRWSPDDAANFTNVGTLPAGMFIVHTMAVVRNRTPVCFEKKVLGDPAAAHALIDALGPVRNQYPARPNYPPMAGSAELFLEPHRFIPVLVKRCSKFQIPKDVWKDPRCIVIDMSMFEKVGAKELLRLVWLLGWYFPEFPLVAEYKEKEYVIVGTGGVLGVGQTFRMGGVVTV